MKQKIIKYSIIVSIFTYIAISIFTQEINNLDELWNFSNARNIANNLLPYKDFNLITTPFFAIINSLSLKLFGTKLYIYRLNYIFLTILLMLSITKLLIKFNINKDKINIFIIIITYFFVTFIYSDYNFFNLILLIITLNLENKNLKNENNYINFIIGIINGLMILTKQTTGLITSLISILIPLIISIIYKEKKSKEILYRFVGITITILLFILYLYKNNIVYDFIDCTILGLRTFKNNITLNIIQIIIIATIIIVLIFLLKELYKIYKSKNKNKKIDLIIIIYSLSLLTLNYPIIDPTHFIISIIPTSIFFIKNHNFKIKLHLLTVIISLLIILNFETFNNIKEYHSKYNLNNFETYQFLIINNREKLIKITDYIHQNEKILIIDHTAITYMLAINKYNHYFDIPLAGNIGSKGEENMINILKNENNTILISENPKTLKEELPKLYEYILENYSKINKIENFQVLKKLT